MNLYLVTFMVYGETDIIGAGAELIFAPDEDTAKAQVKSSPKYPGCVNWTVSVEIVHSDVIMAAAKNYGIIA